MKLISPLQFILGCFGYAKIPLSVIQLSIRQEDMIKPILSAMRGREAESLFADMLKAQQTITSFLRSCRKLGI